MSAGCRGDNICCISIQRRNESEVQDQFDQIVSRNTYREGPRNELLDMHTESDPREERDLRSMLLDRNAYIDFIKYILQGLFPWNAPFWIHRFLF
jgi:hypothetical protein